MLFFVNRLRIFASKTITTMKTVLEKLQKQLQNSTQEEVEEYVQEIRELNY